MSELIAGAALLIAITCLVIVRRVRAVEKRLAFSQQRSDLITVLLEAQLLLRAEVLPLGRLAPVSLSPRCRSRIGELMRKTETLQRNLAEQRSRLDGLAVPEDPGPVDRAELADVASRVQDLAGDGAWLVEQSQAVRVDLDAAAVPYGPDGRPQLRRR